MNQDYSQILSCVDIYQATQLLRSLLNLTNQASGLSHKLRIQLYDEFFYKILDLVFGEASFPLVSQDLKCWFDTVDYFNFHAYQEKRLQYKLEKEVKKVQAIEDLIHLFEFRGSSGYSDSFFSDVTRNTFTIRQEMLPRVCLFQFQLFQQSTQMAMIPLDPVLKYLMEKYRISLTDLKSTPKKSSNLTFSSTSVSSSVNTPVSSAVAASGGVSSPLLSVKVSMREYLFLMLFKYPVSTTKSFSTLSNTYPHMYPFLFRPILYQQSTELIDYHPYNEVMFNLFRELLPAIQKPFPAVIQGDSEFALACVQSFWLSNNSSMMTPSSATSSSASVQDLGSSWVSSSSGTPSMKRAAVSSRFGPTGVVGLRSSDVPINSGSSSTFSSTFSSSNRLEYLPPSLEQVRVLAVLIMLQTADSTLPQVVSSLSNQTVPAPLSSSKITPMKQQPIQQSNHSLSPIWSTLSGSLFSFFKVHFSSCPLNQLGLVVDLLILVLTPWRNRLRMKDSLIQDSFTPSLFPYLQEGIKAVKNDSNIDIHELSRILRSSPLYEQAIKKNFDIESNLLASITFSEWKAWISLHYCFYTYLPKLFLSRLKSVDFSSVSSFSVMESLERLLDVYEPALVESIESIFINNVDQNMLVKEHLGILKLSIGSFQQNDVCISMDSFKHELEIVKQQLSYSFMIRLEKEYVPRNIFPKQSSVPSIVPEQTNSAGGSNTPASSFSIQTTISQSTRVLSSVMKSISSVGESIVSFFDDEKPPGLKPTSYSTSSSMEASSASGSASWSFDRVQFLLDRITLLISPSIQAMEPVCIFSIEKRKSQEVISSTNSLLDRHQHEKHGFKKVDEVSILFTQDRRFKIVLLEEGLKLFQELVRIPYEIPLLNQGEQDESMQSKLQYLIHCFKFVMASGFTSFQIFLLQLFCWISSYRVVSKEDVESALKNEVGINTSVLQESSRAQVDKMSRTSRTLNDRVQLLTGAAKFTPMSVQYKVPETMMPPNSYESSLLIQLGRFLTRLLVFLLELMFALTKKQKQLLAPHQLLALVQLSSSSSSTGPSHSEWYVRSLKEQLLTSPNVFRVFADVRVWICISIYALVRSVLW
jgi:hypothetical protein